MWQHFPQERVPPPAERLWTFLEFLEQESRHFNLTAIHDPREMVSRHFVDALGPFASPRCPVRKADALRVVDIGSGNGVPGLVLAVAFPAWRVALLESNQKKSEFLSRAAEAIGAGNVEILHGRAEVLGREAGKREAYDLAAARALAILPTALELSIPFVATGGWLLAYKGDDCDKEIEVSRGAFDVLCAELVEVDAYPLDPTAAIHKALWIHKTGPTPETYPRRDGLPKKRPLWQRRGST